MTSQSFLCQIAAETFSRKDCSEKSLTPNTPKFLPVVIRRNESKSTLHTSERAGA